MPKFTSKKIFQFFIFTFFACAVCVCGSFAQDIGLTDAQDSLNILPERQRAEVMNEWLKWRLDNIIPELMQREGIDMWLVINREYNEDPVYMSLMPEPTMYARRTSILIFHDQGADKGVQRLSGSYYGSRNWYQGTWTDKTKKQFESLAGVIGWLETRSPQELSVYRHIAGIAHDIIAEFYSNKVITAGITSTDDVVWWIRQKITDLGLETWFQPSISIQRSKVDASMYKEIPRIIQRGDVLHCDVGIVYLGLCTDMQLQAYVCRNGEDDVPDGLKEALRRTIEVGTILRNEFQTGRSGNAIVLSAMDKAAAKGLRPLIYSHPLGIHGHGAGPPMDARPLGNAPEGNSARGEYPLYPNTCYAIEYSCTTSVPEWDGQDVRIGFEESGVYTQDGCKFLDGSQKKFFLIK